MPDEIVDVLNREGNLIGKTISRNLAHKTGVWHACVHIWFFNTKGEVLVQKRSESTFFYPGFWDISCAGHIKAGQTQKDAVLNELHDELGYKLDFKKLIQVATVKTHYSLPELPWFNDNELNHLYLLKFDDDIKKLRFIDKEVAMVKFIPLKKFEKLTKDPLKAKFVPHNYYPLIVEAIKKEL